MAFIHNGRFLVNLRHVAALWPKENTIVFKIAGNRIEDDVYANFDSIEATHQAIQNIIHTTASRSMTSPVSLRETRAPPVSRK